MRESTKVKLFSKKAEFQILRVDELPDGTRLHSLLIDKSIVIVWEFPRDEDGFEVYLKAPGNSTDAAREFIGLGPRYKKAKK